MSSIYRCGDGKSSVCTSEWNKRKLVEVDYGNGIYCTDFGGVTMTVKCHRKKLADRKKHKGNQTSSHTMSSTELDLTARGPTLSDAPERALMCMFDYKAKFS